MEVTDLHLQAARELFSGLASLPYAGPLPPGSIERIAQHIAVLEKETANKTRTVLKTERKIVGDTDRWLIISKTSPSGKAMFVCRSCGRTSVTPDKKCPEPVRLWNGQMRECADWEPSKTPFVG